MAKIAILITPEKKAEIAAAIEEARANVVPWDVMRSMGTSDPGPTLKLEDRPPGFKRPPSIRIEFEPSGVEACISFEEQPAGICRHLSVSTRDGKRMLDEATFILLAAEFGFELPSRKPGRAWVEEYAPGRFALNMVVLEIEREAGHA